jgi:hypothetical protein
MVTGENIPVSTFTGLPYGGRPRLARGRLSVAGQDAAFTRRTFRSSRGARALRIWAVGREYRYREEGNRRHHVLERSDSRIVVARSSWKDPESISGTNHGAVDSVDISLALLFEGVYTRNLSLGGALISAPGRLMDRLGVDGSVGRLMDSLAEHGIAVRSVAVRRRTSGGWRWCPQKPAPRQVAVGQGRDSLSAPHWSRPRAIWRSKGHY